VPKKYTLEITKGQARKDKPETLATLGTQDTEQIHVRDNQRAIKNGQSRNTGNIEHQRHRTKTKKTQHRKLATPTSPKLATHSLPKLATHTSPNLATLTSPNLATPFIKVTCYGYLTTLLKLIEMYMNLAYT
jgi:hypothetical protein